MVVDAYQRVRRGGQGVGVDGESWEKFDAKLQDNLYIIWNRLASGTYHPAAVREIEIPKKDGSKRKLGIPTLRDRIAQSVVKDYMEKHIDHKFHENSYGYRPLKSSKAAIEQVRKNCTSRDWVIDLDISRFFDEIDQELLIKAVERMIEEKWVRMYVGRWLAMKIQDKGGVLHDRQGKGTPQGGVISPLLANIFLHYALDKWLEKHYSHISFVRYADDMIIHCSTEQEAKMLLNAIKERLSQVKLQLNEKKTHIVYCKDYRRRQQHHKVQFDFLGFSYQPRTAKSKHQEGSSFTAFTAEISQDNQKKIREEINKSINWRNTRMEITDIADKLNSKLRGWINYFGIYAKRNLRRTLQRLDCRLLKWLRDKHKLKGIRKATVYLRTLMLENKSMFFHWEKGYGYFIKK
jgi:group II intron reverse transcriptase/maturase